MQYIEAEIAKERVRPDPGSPISRVAMMYDGALFDVLEGGLLHAGLADLRRAGLVDEDNVLAPDGLALVTLIKSRSSMSLVDCARREAEGLVTDSLLLLGSSDSLLTGAWHFNSEGRADSLALSAMPATNLLEMLDRLLEPPDTSNTQQHNAGSSEGLFCVQCGAQHDAGQNFCRQCGAQL